jgi:hypothetical protein
MYLPSCEFGTVNKNLRGFSIKIKKIGYQQDKAWAGCTLYRLAWLYTGSKGY